MRVPHFYFVSRVWVLADWQLWLWQPLCPRRCSGRRGEQAARIYLRFQAVCEVSWLLFSWIQAQEGQLSLGSFGSPRWKSFISKKLCFMPLLPGSALVLRKGKWVHWKRISTGNFVEDTRNPYQGAEQLWWWSRHARAVCKAVAHHWNAEFDKLSFSCREQNAFCLYLCSIFTRQRCVVLIRKSKPPNLGVLLLFWSRFSFGQVFFWSVSLTNIVVEHWNGFQA